jgi:hypothetical protein
MITLMLRSFAMPNWLNYDVSLPLAMRQCCRVDNINIAGESSLPSCNDGFPPILAKSMDPDESCGNAIVLTVLKDVVNNNYLSVVTCADVVTCC